MVMSHRFVKSDDQIEMGQNQTHSSRNARIKKYFSLLCAEPRQQTELKLQTRERPGSGTYPPKKKSRMTFQLDGALTKLSRKNLAIQEFPTKNSITDQIDAYLLQRLNSQPVVLFQGHFTEKIVSSVVFPIRKGARQTEQNLEMVEKVAGEPQWRQKTIDCLVVNGGDGGAETLKEALERLGGRVENFVLVLKEGEMKDYIGTFLSYRDKMMFQKQKIMLGNQAIAILIYASPSCQFLRINVQALAVFLVQTMLALGPVLNPVFMTQLLTRLIDRGLAVQVADVVCELMALGQGARHYDEEFILRMEQKHPHSLNSIEELPLSGDLIRERDRQASQPRFHRDTPQFISTIQNLGVEEEGPETRLQGRCPEGEISFRRWEVER